MKTRTLILMGLACCAPSCGETDSSTSSALENDESTSLWPEPEIPEGQGAAGNDRDNPWLGGSGARSSTANGGQQGSESSGGVAPSSPGKPGVEEPSKPRSGDNSGGGTLSTDPEPEPSRPELLLTRYEESTGSEKRLEIENLGRSIEAGECALSIFSNGNIEPFRTLSLDAFGEAGRARLCTTQVSDAICTGSLGSSSFNGNDALVLSCGPEVIDSFGRVGEDPGRGWSDGAARTWDATLVRCDRSADRDPTDPVVLGRFWVPGPFETETTEDLCPSSFGLGGAPPRP